MSNLIPSDVVHAFHLKNKLKSHLFELEMLSDGSKVQDAPRIAVLKKSDQRFTVSFFPESLSPGCTPINSSTPVEAKKLFRELANLWTRGTSRG